MRLFRWTPDFDPEYETSLSPVWISFFGLPLHMFNFHALSLICKPIGKLLGVDSVNLAKAKPHVARVCVEMDLLQPRLKEIFVGTSEVVGDEDCGFVQPVVYEKVPFYCDYCWRQGHSLARCRLKDFSPPPTPIKKPTPQNPIPPPKPTRPSRILNPIPPSPSLILSPMKSSPKPLNPISLLFPNLSYMCQKPKSKFHL
ncbi:hypothetical protein DM860_016368 [Cuscuta australis]|uniref:Uncharacterized protein n=1 Tax=Cuscuta australis TaxID=267555 RepID=A0A328DE01_9ASTE|nr:hypothetical protein DM860_016368 [Cuscuta australis]